MFKSISATCVDRDPEESRQFGNRESFILLTYHDDTPTMISSFSRFNCRNSAKLHVLQQVLLNV